MSFLSRAYDAAAGMVGDAKEHPLDTAMNLGLGAVSPILGGLLPMADAFNTGGSADDMADAMNAISHGDSGLTNLHMEGGEGDGLMSALMPEAGALEAFAPGLDGHFSDDLFSAAPDLGGGGGDDGGEPAA